MFSMTTTELSTSIPMPRARPDKLRIFSVMPEKYMRTMAKSTLRGMLMATTSVGRTSFKKMASTRMARTAPQMRFDMTLSTMIWM